MQLPVLCQTTLLFFLYSFIGWVCESFYCSVPAHKFINRGFLSGPLCPVYGVGALLIVWILTPVSGDIGILFVFGIFVTSSLEYITSIILEKLFHMKWWDYSQKRCNIHGRVCLMNSVLFGIMAVVLMEVIHPCAQQLVIGISPIVIYILAVILLGIFTADLIYSIYSTLQFSGKLRQLHAVLAEIQEKSQLRTLDFSNRLKQLRQQQFHLEHHHPLSHRRIMNAFPHMRSTRYREEGIRLRDALEQLRKYKKKKNT